MTWSKLLELKEVLQNATDLQEPAILFWEVFASDHSFMAAGKPEAHSRLKDIIEQVATRALGSAQTAERLVLIRLAAYQFWHGSCVLGEKMAQVIYFDDIDCGLLTILRNPLTGETQYTRFSVVKLARQGHVLAMNPREKPSA